MKTSIVRLLTLVVLAAGAAACGSDSPTAPPTFVGPAELQITDLTVGTGATVAAGQTINVNYALWLYDPNGPNLKGTQIPSQTPLTVTLSPGGIIQGWIQGVPGMKVGGIRRLLIPPSLAYGASGSGPIPPNAWIVFDIELLAIAP
ncbi:MAG: FKBP-type peptidyl-prolyl cis-trans isomerase [Acidobacteria bacterium]|nr:FKBP-type peptidyl-prolyl cis-trans isomerase [Acidobacteriota bacterium]